MMENETTEIKQTAEAAGRNELVVMSDFEVGQDLDWLHGLHSHRIATVLKVTEDKVFLQGVTTTYWMSKRALSEKIGRPMPRVGIFSCSYS